MPKALKRGSSWLTNVDVPCIGIDCKTPGKLTAHTHRKRLAFRTRDEAETKSQELKQSKNELKNGTAPGEISWLAFKAKFLIYSKSKNKQTHYRDTLALRYLEFYYPVTQLKQMTPEILIRLRQRLVDDGKHAWNVNRILSALKAMMRFAEDTKLIEPQAWRLARQIPTPKGRLIFWRTNEIQALYGVCKGIWGTMARLAIEAGLRREEIHTLKVSNIDFKQNRIHIVGDETWIPKSTERRSIPMKPELSKHLKNAINGSAYVLGDDRPGLDVISSYFRKLIKNAHLSGSLHTGRHTYGSHLTLRGIPLAVIQKRMGHASIKTTEIYSHLSDDLTDEVYEA